MKGLRQKPTEIPAEALVLWVHRKQHMAILDLHRVRDGRARAYQMPLNDAFTATLALDTEEGPIAVTASDLEAIGLPLEDAIRRGVANCAAWMGVPSISEGVCTWKTRHAEALVTVGGAMATKLPIRGRPVAIVPAEGLSLLAGADDTVALARMLDIAEDAYAASEEFRSLRAIWWPDGKASAEWLPPANNPLRARFAAAAARTRVQEAEGLHHYLAPDGANLAPLSMTQSGEMLVASWYEGETVVFPFVDAVAMLDAHRSGPPLAVEFKALREKLPDAFEELSFESAFPEARGGQGAGEPMLYLARADRYPSARERASLFPPRESS